ncbi:MAG TPA: aminoglycoside phosphotransferase [Thiotrichales bacterium]|nr:aminoglycoside phosphotransferase [Thiotrichales bacterium]
MPNLWWSVPLSQRIEVLERWLKSSAGLVGPTLEPASSDASFRRYFRVRHAGGTHIVMDAPPEREDCRPFVAVARDLAAIGIHVPEIVAEDLEQGFLLLTDLGDQLYLDALSDDTVERLYGDALGALATLQVCGPQAYQPPPYDSRLLSEELELFREWYLRRQTGLVLGEDRERLLDELFGLLVDNALEQPVVLVHRDYHSRNLMVCDRHNPGVLDFQDAVMGPVTYDLVSLLRDCYIRWPREQVREWALGYHDLAVQSGILRDGDEERFLRWFDLMGVQRHLKATGIFARLHLRDRKSAYLDHIPRTLGYVGEIAAEYPELAPLAGLLDELEERSLAS